ncbi:MAG: PilZ domain-containing protein [Lachnospiraceae bacterium]|nr:PilZ domain-containing protein [Lachnospiraceae bacterium]
MNYADIPMGVRVQISVTNGGDTQAKFISRVMKTGNKALLVIPFMHKGVRVNFSGTGVQIHMEVPDGEGNNWTFKNCKIDTVKKNGLLYHRIVSPMSEGIENRRGERRTYVWVPAIFTIEGLPDQLFTTLKDVSPSGFAFVLDAKKRLPISTGKNVSCTVNEKDGTTVHMSGKVIRREKMDQYVLYGCRCNDKNPEVIEYIERMKKRKQKNENDSSG